MDWIGDVSAGESRRARARCRQSGRAMIRLRDEGTHQRRCAADDGEGAGPGREPVPGGFRESRD